MLFLLQMKQIIYFFCLTSISLCILEQHFNNCTQRMVGGFHFPRLWEKYFSFQQLNDLNLLFIYLFKYVLLIRTDNT